jgi:hypothetical protein
MLRRTLLRTFLLSALCTAGPVLPAAEIPGFRPSAWFAEQVHEQWFKEGIRVLVNAPGGFDSKKPARLVLFATPNGNTLEQTLGCATAGKTDWHYDIQHVAAQVRRLREVSGDSQIVLACLEAEGLSWPAWKKTRPDGPNTIRTVVDAVRQWIGSKEISIALAGHSGGGSFLFGFIDADQEIPDAIERIIFLDANYSYTDDKHGDKIIAWLKKDAAHRLVVLAYDDRRITLNGKLVVGPDGGTYRATERMLAGFGKRKIEISESARGDFRILRGMNGQITMLVHKNPRNKILHTALVGEMNGLLCGLSSDAPQEKWGTFGPGAPGRAYTKWIQPAPAIPGRPADAVGGKAFFKGLEKLTRQEREEAIAREIIRGNFPDFLRSFKLVKLAAKGPSGKGISATLEVMPDYLAIGSNADFVRVPMSPRTACRIAEAFGCSLPTRKIVDAIYLAADLKLRPMPLTEAREAVATFEQHNRLIENERGGAIPGQLVAGIKKDLVLSNRLEERPNRVAIYGWHTLDGKPIQPLNVSHVNWYVDYSHGARMIKRQIDVEGQSRDLHLVLFSEKWSPLVSDEGPIRRVDY